MAASICSGEPVGGVGKPPPRSSSWTPAGAAANALEPAIDSLNIAKKPGSARDTSAIALKAERLTRSCSSSVRAAVGFGVSVMARVWPSPGPLS